MIMSGHFVLSKNAHTIAISTFQQVTLYGSSLSPSDTPPEGTPVTIEGLEKPAVVHKGGMTVTGNDGKMVSKCLF